ncbi:uncharacterized protein JCM6883_007241 [Sporobolomyces salmoneus]|uniref:uncharacterized protein n=1 Tax=Sporobolomyces salmoneus TaxID=183962 RepID=UPI003180AE31
MSNRFYAPYSQRSPAVLTPIPRKVFLRELVLGAAGSSDSIYDKLFDGRTDVVPVLTGWTACMMAAGEENRSDLTRKVLANYRPQTVFTAECVLLRSKQTSEEEDSKAKEEIHEIIRKKFPSRLRGITVNLPGGPGPILVNKPYTLDVDLSKQDLEACFVRYSPEGTKLEFKLLSGPLFIMTRLKLGIKVTERRSDMWQQLLLYLLTVHNLNGGTALKEGFHLLGHDRGHEKWVELAVKNSESSVIGLEAHKEVLGWLRHPLGYRAKVVKKKMRHAPVEDFERETTGQTFRNIAQAWSERNVGVGQKVIYENLVQLKVDLISEFEFLIRQIEIKLNDPNASPRPASSSSPFVVRSRSSSV